MTTDNLIGVFVSAAAAVIGGLLSSSLLDRLTERRQKVRIVAKALEPASDGARAWLIRFVLNRPVHESGPIICYLGEAGNRFVAHVVLGHRDVAQRVTVNERGHLECDVSYMEPGQEVAVRCYLARRDTPQFHAPKSSLDVGVNAPLSLSAVRGRSLTVAKWRVLWIVGLMLWLGFAALVRLVYLHIH